MAGPIRVAQVMGYMNGGGVESVVMNYYRQVNRSRVQFDFIVCEGSTLVPRDEIESFGGRVFMVPPYSHVLGYQRTLATLFNEQDYKIVHSHMNALSVFSLRAAKRAGVPVRIAHSHSSNGGGKGEIAKDAMKKILRRFSRIYPTHLLACSRIAGDWLFGPDSGYKVIPNAVDIAAFSSNGALRAETRRALGISCTTFVVGHIGRIVPPKNHLFLLNIFKEVLAIEPDSLLVIVGEGPLLDGVRAATGALGISNKVRFLGQRSDTAALYQAFDIFCLPSVYEGLPMVGVECQASGTPILASDAVTQEAAMTSLMEFEPLASPSEVWARHLLAMRGKTFAPEDAVRLGAFDVTATTKKLEAYYEGCMKGAGL